ncbi:hypothetical protein G9A89_019153 [Geosiphon pyriformis]|nr:hypothetical protein G9A89_019153 [Geosiphon pyriformis]
MKFLLCISLLFAIVTFVSAHSSMKFPLPRGSPLNPNASVKDFACITSPLNGGPGCAPKKFPCGGYKPDRKITQVFKAGQVIDVSFYNPNFPKGPKSGDERKDQARHNGGLCEFALSYDGGITYTVIATYHETCPDIFFNNWKVKIPKEAPSCDNPGKCIFSWSWINAEGNPEFYQNCADVKIVGTSKKPLPIIDITRGNLPPKFPKKLTPNGDPSDNGNGKGSGPRKVDVKANLRLHLVGRKSRLSNSSSNTDSSNGQEITLAEDKVNNAIPIQEPIEEPPKDKAAKNGQSKNEPAKHKKPKKCRKNSKSKKRKHKEVKLVSVKSSANNKAACDLEGRYTCVDPDSSSAFTICNNGKLVEQDCPATSVCSPLNESIVCKFP